MNNVQAASALRAAAQHLRDFPWIQGQLEDEWGGVCAVGAIHAATAASFDEGSQLCEMVEDRLELRYIDRDFIEMPLAAWNDKPGRTKEEVIAAFEETASALLTAPIVENVRELVPA